MSQPKPFVSSAAEFDAAFQALQKPGQPNFFSLRAPLPRSGRTDTPVAATPQMTAVVKCYAATGENALHAHTTEDHVFIVLQGEAHFYGPKGELKVVKPQHGVMLPRGTFYRFEAGPAEPLVMVRIGAAAVTGGSMNDRVGSDGVPMAGDSAQNHQVETVLSGEWFGPAHAR